MRPAVLAVLVLTGCTMVEGTAPRHPAVQLGAFAPSAPVVPVVGMTPLVDAFGEGPAEAIMTAEATALQSPGSGAVVEWSWKNHSGRVKPGPLYMVNARTCRNLTHVAERDHERHTARTTLCLSREGAWERLG